MKVLAVLIAIVLSYVDGYKNLVKRSDSVDWRTYKTTGGHPVLSEVQDQLGCGNCYGFAITGAIEANAAISLDKKVVPLSQQFFVDCFGVDGCAGGSLNDFLKAIEKEQYVPAAVDYKYKGYHLEGRCDPLGPAFERNEEVARNGMANYLLVIHKKLSNNFDAFDEALRRGPTIHGMFVSSDSFHWKSDEASSDEGVVDSSCTVQGSAHAWTFVGFTPKHYTIKGSYGQNWAAKGYVNYNKEKNINCNMGYRAYSVVIVKRKEIEYKVGKGMLSFGDAKVACASQFGSEWTLATIPTAWHRDQAYAAIKARYGDDKKDDDKYNYVWIGLRAAHDVTKVRWLDETPAYYRPISGNKVQPNAKMAKFAGSDGGWRYEPATTALRFLCSRYRSEECPRKYWMDIGDDALSVTYSSLDIVQGTTMTVKCKDGNIPSNDGTATCNDGKWSADITCDVAPTTGPWWSTAAPSEAPGCAKFDFSPFSISKIVQSYSEKEVDGQYPPGTTLTVKIKSCKSGFKKKLSKSTLKCEDGAWSSFAKNPCEEKKRKEIRRAIMV